MAIKRHRDATRLAIPRICKRADSCALGVAVVLDRPLTASSWKIPFPNDFSAGSIRPLIEQSGLVEGLIITIKMIVKRRAS